MNHTYIYNLMSENNQAVINQFQCQGAPFVGYTKLAPKPVPQPVPRVVYHPDAMISGARYS